MTLENLLKIGMLKAHETGKDEIKRLLDAASRNIADAGVMKLLLDAHILL